MNPRDDAPKNPLDDINPEDDVELQAIEALEARTVDPNPGPLRVPTRHRDQPVPERVITPEPKPVEKVIVPAPVVEAPKPAKVIAPVVAPPKPQPVAAPKVEPKIIQKPEPKAVPLTASAQMDNELAKAPPLNVAQTIRQFFGKQKSSHPSAIIVVLVLLILIAAGGYFVWHYLQA